jgi:hypothetical protein
MWWFEGSMGIFRIFYETLPLLFSEKNPEAIQAFEVPIGETFPTFPSCFARDRCKVEAEIA